MIYQRRAWASDKFFAAMAKSQSEPHPIVPDVGKYSNYSFGGFIAGVAGSRFLLLYKTMIAKYHGSYVKKTVKAFDEVPHVPYRKLFREVRVAAVVVGKRVYIAGTRLVDISSGSVSKYVLNAIGIGLCTLKYYYIVDVSTNSAYTWYDKDIITFESASFIPHDAVRWMEATDKFWKSSGSYWDPVSTTFVFISFMSYFISFIMLVF
jgi:hypothetical protein